jgi:RND family efflux transporter MFP subunit
LEHRALDDQVASAQANLVASQAKLNGILSGARREDIAAANAQANAAQAGVAQAQANVESAKQKQAQAQAGGRAESVGQAQAKLDADQASLAKLFNGAHPLDVTSARLAVEQAKDKLFADQTSNDRQVQNQLISKEIRQAALDVDQTAIDQANTMLARLMAPPRPEDMAQLQAAVNADKQALEIAKQPNRPEDVAQLQQAVGAAQAQVDQAQQQAAGLRALAVKAAQPYTADDITQARAGVGVAEASLQSAQTQLGYATVRAPSEGIVSEVPVAVGSQVGPATAIATLISSDVVVQAQVEESQVAIFKEGQAASITPTGAMSDVAGRVLVVAPAADAKTRKFMVKVAPLSPSGTLRAGMSAAVSIQTGQQDDAVLIPKDAVLQRNGQQIVFTDEHGRAKLNAVQVAGGDATNAHISSGIATGAAVILPGSIELSDGQAVTATTEPGPATTAADDRSAS